MNPLRPVILAAAGSGRMKNAVTRVPLTAAVVRRFVAGETRGEPAPVARDLLASGRMISVDFLGEYTTEQSTANAAVAEYMSLIDDLAALEAPHTLVPAVEVSVKRSALVEAAGSRRSPGDFEFRMLYGIRDPEQRRLVDEGHTLRVYLPYGTQWYGYLMRRIAERPANLAFFLRALAERR
ncbi:proline dehydrogenase family protein [Nocardia sp. NPDC088792]|uniref:proline dehydrogenase family protein n=1 Tax=Nocardia sp. NPDC088792 TaxID=3364332 RepID=UPI00381A3570